MYNFSFPKQFMQKFYCNLNEQKLTHHDQLIMMNCEGIDLNLMLFTMHNQRGFLDCLLLYRRNILMSLLHNCKCLEFRVFHRIY